MNGQDAPLARDGVSTVDPGAGFRVEVSAHLVDGRLALHDESDAMVASSGMTEVGATFSRYHLTPVEALRPGSAYVLRLDGAAERETHAADGATYAPLVLKLRTSGERPPPPKQHKRRR